MSPNLLIIFAITLATSIQSTILVKKACFKYNILDIPNNRSSHVTPKALMGGIAIIVSFIIGYMLLYSQETQLNTNTIYILLPALAISLLGLFDDIYNLSAKIRFSLQLLLSITTILIINYRFNTSISVITITLSILAIIFLIGTTNIYNFMDGIDGIAAGSGIIYAIFFAIAGNILNNDLVFYTSILLIPAQLGFLIFNFPPAKIFMGDVGSTFLGYIYATLTILLAINNPLFILVGTGIMFPFLFDGAFTIIKRFIQGKNIFEAHRDHFYQKLIKDGWSHKKVSFLYYFFELISGSVVVGVLFLF
jgi:UDP-N-acetylmuramyl pentapeptide phosphotransferase/UDP-N-acetylglucosamine-1-phosphate transferase